jgi:hypothetical protein
VFGDWSSRYHCAPSDPEEPGPGVIEKLPPPVRSSVLMAGYVTPL